MVVVGVAVICGIVPDHEVPADGGRRLPPGRGTGPGRAGRSTIRGPADRRRSRARAHRVVSLCKRSLEVYDPRRPATAGIAPRRGLVRPAAHPHGSRITGRSSPRQSPRPAGVRPRVAPHRLRTRLRGRVGTARRRPVGRGRRAPAARGCRRSSGTLYLILRSEVRCP